MVVEYRIIGEGPQKEQCTRFIRDRGLQDVVKLIGNLPQQSVIRHLHESDLFIAANVTAQNGCLDGPINTAKEAMATGLPVVATRQGGIPELVEDSVNGFLVPQHDSKALQERVEWLIKHTDTWCQLAEAGRRRVEQEYDLEYWNEMLVQRYFEALNSPSQMGGLDEQSPNDNRRRAA